MPHFHVVTEADLQSLARAAISAAREQSLSLTDAVVKVASACEHRLTDQHARRVCEMVYHDVYERTFRDSPGPDRLVSFDPPDAEKVAEMVNLERVKSFHDKVAAAVGPGTTEKTAAAVDERLRPPPIANAWVSAMRSVGDGRDMQKEAAADLRRLRAEVREAVTSLRDQVSTAEWQDKAASLDMYEGVLSAVRYGASATQVLAAVATFAKEAGVDDDVAVSLVSDCAGFLAHRGVGLDKTASAPGDVEFNSAHPLRADVKKVASLRGFGMQGTAALDVLCRDLATIEQGIQDVLLR